MLDAEIPYIIELDYTKDAPRVAAIDSIRAGLM